MGYLGTAQEICLYCAVTGGTGVGWQVNGSSVLIDPIAANNTGSGSDGFAFVCDNADAIVATGLVSYGNGRDGIRFTGDASSGNCPITLWNSILYGNAGYGFNNTGTTGTATSYAVAENYNGYGSNTLGATNNLTQGAQDVTLTANPFTNGAGNVFTLNNTSGGGLSLQAAGFPGALQAGGTGYLDIGALQHQVTGNGPKGFGFVGP